MRIEIVVRRLCLLVLVLTLGLVGASAADYYVSPQGNDANSGSATQPLRTITRAYSLATAGTTIIVLPGVYTDYTSNWGLRLGKSGTASSPITLKSQVRGGAIIDGQNAGDRNVAIYLDGSYNIVDGFEIRGGPLGGLTIWGNYNQILNNKIHHNGTLASSSTLGQDGVYSSQDTRNNVYQANTIYDNGRTGSNLDHALYLCGDNEVVVNNVLIRNAAYGLHIAGYTTVSNMKVYNNVIAFNGKSGIILWMAVSGVDIKNNIIYQNGRYGIDSWDAHGSGVVVDRNLVFGNASGNYSFINGASDYGYTLGTTITSAPLFVNSASASFDPHLSAGSPALNAGLNLSTAFTTDLDGASRPGSGPWDLGAYEYGSADTTSPTVSLTAPANSATVSGTSVTVTANATDNVGVAGVQFKLDGANLGGEDTSAPYGVTLNSTTLVNGTHTLSAVARDAAGNQTPSTPVSVIVSNSTPVTLPTVTVVASDANAARLDLDNGAFTITRTGSTTSALTVNCSLGGTAVAGVDYETLSTSVTIPAGSASAAITLVPKPAATCVGPVAATLKLNANSGYTVGSPGNASVTIAGNSVPSTLRKVSGNVQITWASTPGKIYRVARKTSLSDAIWTDVSGDLTATETITSWTDTTAGASKQRYYSVYVTN